MRSASSLAGVALAIAVLLGGRPAAGQTDPFSALRGDKGSPEVWKMCEGQDGIAPDKQADACSAFLDYGGADVANRAGAYINRGNAGISRRRSLGGT